MILFQQAKDVYTTLKENNVPSELPRFVLSQVSEIVDVQIVYCKQLGVYLTTTIKVNSQCVIAANHTLGNRNNYLRQHPKRSKRKLI